MKPNTGPGLALDTAAAGAGDCLLSGEHCQYLLSGDDGYNLLGLSVTMMLLHFIIGPSVWPTISAPVFASINLQNDAGYLDP